MTYVLSAIEKKYQLLITNYFILNKVPGEVV
jgi:hypothetical protein